MTRRGPAAAALSSVLLASSVCIEAQPVADAVDRAAYGDEPAAPFGLVVSWGREVIRHDADSQLRLAYVFSPDGKLVGIRHGARLDAIAARALVAFSADGRRLLTAPACASRRMAERS